MHMRMRNGLNRVIDGIAKTAFRSDISEFLGESLVEIEGIEGFIQKPFQSGGTLTIQMYLSATSEGDFETAFGIAVVLLIIVLGINLGTKALTKHFDVTRKE